MVINELIIVEWLIARSSVVILLIYQNRYQYQQDSTQQ